MSSSSQSNLVPFINAPLEIIDGDRGKNYPKQDDFFENEFCLFLNAGNVTKTGFDFSKCAFITKEKDSVLRKGKLQRGDLVLTTRGTVGNVAYYDSEVPFEHIRINSGMVIIRTQQNELDPKFLYAYLRSNLFENQVNGLTTGSAQPQLPIRDINRIDLPMFPIKHQRSIADVIGNLDRKIALNNQINETLESMAKAIFKEWFIDFGPVRAKAEGKKPFGMDDETAALFPDSFEDSELGPIPKSWKVCRLSEIIELLSGGTPKTTNEDYWNGNIPWFSVVDTPKGSDVWLIDTEKKITQLGVDNSATRILPIGTTIISARGTVGNLALTAVPTAMNQSCYGVKGNGYGDLFVYLTIGNMVSQLKQNSHGSVFDTITRDTFNGISMVVPPKENLISRKFEATVTTLFEQIKTNVFETQTLIQTRELLLPKLISGEISLTAEVENG